MAAAEAIPTHILIVDDDQRLRALLTRFLEEHDFIVTDAADAADARHKLGYFEFDAAVVDVMMPGENGRELTRWIKQERPLPILMLTAMGDVEDRIQGLEAGADDYLGKPFEPRELLLRLKNLLRRAEPPPSLPTDPAIRFGRFSLDPERLLLTREGQPVALTLSEAMLLKELARQIGTPVSRIDLARQSPDTQGSERSVDVQITRLRRKIEPEPGKPQHILTVRGEGYVLKP